MAEITHASVGRINVAREQDGGVTLKLFQWGLKPDATLSRDEGKLLVRRLNEALEGRKATPADDDFSDLA